MQGRTSADVAAMAQAATYIDDARAQLDGLRTRVASSIAGSSGGWATDAATTFRSLMDQWATDFAAIIQSLDATREKLVGTRTNLTGAMDAESAGTSQMASALNNPA